MAQMEVSVEAVRRGDRYFHNNPPGSSCIVDRVEGSTIAGAPSWVIHENAGEFPNHPLRAGTKVMIERKPLEELETDELKNELDRRMKVRQLRDIVKVKEMAAELQVEVRSIQSEHWELTSIEAKSFNADDILEAVWAALLNAEQRLEES